jgi:hypothetical protein
VNCEGSYQGKLSAPSLVYYFCSCIIGQLVTIYVYRTPMPYTITIHTP